MDGIDGIAGIQTLSIGLGIYIIGAINMPFDASHGQALVLAAAAIGFLAWNWHPARIFLGDVGSIPMGFLVGWLLLNLASNGFWQAALILQFYYLVDSTLTLIKRIMKGMVVWQPHKEHFYQVENTNLLDLGLDPKLLSENVVITMLQKVMVQASNIRPQIIMPTAQWTK